MKPTRRANAAGGPAIAESAGTIASSSGSPTRAAAPRRKVRRGIDMFVMIMVRSPQASESRRLRFSSSGVQLGRAVLQLRVDAGAGRLRRAHPKRRAVHDAEDERRK